MKARYFSLACIGFISVFSLCGFPVPKAYACNDFLGRLDPTCKGGIFNPNPNSGSEVGGGLVNSNASPACSSKYDPRPYRPGTSRWNGRVGQIAFNNSTSTSVKVTLFHPDAPARAFKSWNVQPGQNLFLGGDNYGMDWGIQVDRSRICILGSVSDWNSFNGSQIFQTWVERVRR
jgi:hypothetical protein